MKLIIDIQNKVIAHIRSNYGHGVKCLYDEDKDIIIDAIYENRTLQAELEKIKAEIENMWIKSAKDLKTGEIIYENLCEHSEVLEIIDNRIKELKGEDKEKPFDRTDDCLSYEESFCEARDCGECCFRE